MSKSTNTTNELWEFYKTKFSEGKTPREKAKFLAKADAFVKLCKVYNARPERHTESL